MYNEDYNEYDELEKIYYKRKIKKYFTYFLVITILFVVLFLFISNLKSEKEVKTNNAIDSKFIIPKKEIIKKENEKLTLDPMIPEVKNVHQKPKSIKKEVRKEVKKEIAKVRNKPNPKIVIKVSKEGYSLKDLIENYNSFPNYKAAIKIANIYFNQGKYNKCIEWAKKANNIDSQKEESWLLYAKSLVKMGNKKTAKKLLNAYLNIYGENKKIEEYLRSIK